METWILENVRARNARRVGAWAAVAACLGLFAAGHSRYVVNFVGGPYPLSAADLGAIAHVAEAPRYFARVAGSRVLDTGLQEVTVSESNGVETDRSVSAGYYALVVGDKLLVCKSRSGSRTTFVGELTPMPPDLEQHLFGTADMKAIRYRFYPFYLDDEPFRVPGYWALGGLAVFGLLLLRYARPAWRYLRDPASHPLIERVEKWGDPVGVAVAAERELRSPVLEGGGGWALTEQFLVRSTFFTFDLLRLSDLLWAYKKVTKHSVNFIPTGKTYEAILACYGGTATVPGNEKRVNEVLRFAAQRTPWAIFGFSKELESCFKTNVRAFCSAVERRRAELAKAPPVQKTA
jgi:Family of unknown function (DUF6709)